MLHRKVVCVYFLFMLGTEASHERIRTNHFLDSHTNRKLSIAIAKLGHIDADRTCVIVKLDEPLESLSLEPLLNLNKRFFLNFFNCLLDCELFTYGSSKN